MTKARRPRTEIIIAVAATVVSICAMVTTVYQTYILRQQQHAAVWPRLQLAHGYGILPDTAIYRLDLANNGIGPAVIRQVSINYQDSSFISIGALAIYIAQQSNLPDEYYKVYASYRDVIPDMVIPQQENLNLLLMNDSTYIIPFIKEIGKGSVQMIIQYESLYGETWEVSYPGLSHRRID